ncbi:Vacuolar protein-sorting-associated protein 25 [Spathaspora sp. JA1]|nr:Vacuolar protein-sorting-associated protein 25 [Spathaspora sp. JA1]
MTDIPTPFEFPKIHSFPPLYTKQPNTTILSHQLEAWTTIILEYCQHYRITRISKDGIAKHSQISQLDLNSLPSIFSNTAINRTVNSEFKTLIINSLIHKLHSGEYVNSKKPELGIFVYWKKLEDWGSLLYQYVDDSGQLGTVLTVYELTKSDEDGGSSGLPQDLRGLDETFLIKIIKDYLMKLGKAQILMNENNEIGGVKIV